MDAAVPDDGEALKRGVVEGVFSAGVSVLAIGANDGGDGGGDGFVLRDEGDGRADVDAEARGHLLRDSDLGFGLGGLPPLALDELGAGGRVSFQVRLTERKARRGKCWSLRSAAETPSTESTRAVVMGSSSGSAETDGWLWRRTLTPEISESAMSMRKTLGRFGAAEMFISLTASFCTR